MPSWVFILLLVLALGAFLYILRQLGQMKSLLAERPPARVYESEEPKTEAVQVAMATVDPAAVQASLDALSERVEALHEELRLMALEVGGMRQAGDAAASTHAEGNGPGSEGVAHRHLAQQGCSQIQITSKRAESDAIRYVVKARRGDELLMGHVIVRGDVVIESRLEVPSALFP